jgi:hypothetical protein
VDNNNNRPWQNNRNRNGNRQDQQKNRIKEKELAMKTSMIDSFRKTFEKQVESLDRHDVVLKEILPQGFVGKVASGKTASLPRASGIVDSLNSYFSKIGIPVIGTTYQTILVFLGEYQVWRDKKIAEYKEAMDNNVITIGGAIETESSPA